MNSSTVQDDQYIFNINEDEKQKFLDMCKNQAKKNEIEIKKRVNEVKVI